jgi:predicted nucleic acid-binding protein
VTHLDTSFLIRTLVRGSPEDRALRRLLASEEPLGISVICWAEFLCGPISPQVIEPALRLVGDPIRMDATDAARGAQLYNATGRRRGSLLDCLIAAVAIRAGATLATANAADFNRLEPHGLAIVVAA